MSSELPTCSGEVSVSAAEHRREAVRLLQSYCECGAEVIGAAHVHALLAIEARLGELLEHSGGIADCIAAITPGGQP